MAERDQLQREMLALQSKVVELSNRPSPLNDQLTSAARERDETQRALTDAITQLNDLKRSRFLKIGRLLRRLAGLPVPY